MKSIVVLVTCGSRSEARRLARTLVQKKLAACVNVASASVISVYRWHGRVESASEIPLMIKTTRRNFSTLEKEIRRQHSYDMPEIVALPIVAGSAAYLRWLAESVSDRK